MLLLSSADFFKINFSKNSSGTLSQCQMVPFHFSSVDPYLGPNCLKRSLADDKSSLARKMLTPLITVNLHSD